MTWMARALAVFAGVLVIVTSAGLAGARINTTGSFPVGLYWTTEGEPSVGDLVIFCPPDSPMFDLARSRGYISNGNCGSGHQKMIKRLWGQAGDYVAVSAVGVSVNGTAVPNTVVRESDDAGRPLTRMLPRQHLIRTDEVLLLSEYSAASFDGRYFGLIERSQIKSVLVPVFVVVR